MRVYRRLEDLPRDRRRAVTVGVFDGVHRGHRRILAALLGAARRRRLDASCAITFWPHPMAVLRPERAPGLLLTLEERIAALADTGLDELLILPFDREVAATDYATIERRAGGTQIGSVTNALSAGALFVVAMVLSLPLWLVPGLGIVIPLLLTAWLNRRAFRYDALMMHADRDEMKLIPERNASGLMMLGVGCALLAYVPILNLVAPAFCGLAFVHYLLEALQQHRQASGWVVLDKPS